MNEQTGLDPETIIKLDNVGKRFELVAEAPDSVFELLISRFSRNRQTKRIWQRKHALWAVKDVNLDVVSGECVGFLGQNGSGKSTLLKLITRILHPTTGRITVQGRIGALLELGAGFHPELTGRENIFLNASILGLSKQEIHTHFDSVVAFSELEEFIDTPVKFYSSGMYMRLGFSVAIHVNPQILIVDEILAVGDQAFQEKCINHIFDMKRRGTTIILVSHNLDMMRKLCTRLIWMEKGQVRASGNPEDMIQKYLVFLQTREHRSLSQVQKDFERLGTGDIEITGVRFLDKDQQEQPGFVTGEALTIEISYVAHRAVLNPEFGLAIYREDGVQINGPNTQFSGFDIGKISGAGAICYHVPELPLLPACYVLSVAVHDSRYPIVYDHHVKAYEFQVSNGSTREIFGVVLMPAKWSWSPGYDGLEKQR
jgi:lipopolysaccharide transport system ATP-binding protein